MSTLSQPMSALLLQLHEGQFQKPLWRDFLESVRVRLSADHCGIYFRRGDVDFTGATGTSVGAPRPTQLDFRYLEVAHRYDPVPYERLQVGKVHSLGEFMLAENPEHDIYREEYLRPTGMNEKRILRISAQDGYNAWLTVWRRKGAFSRRDDAFLAELCPHLTLAIKVFAQGERERIRASIADDAVRRLDFGWLTLDARGIIIDRDEIAERWLVSSPALVANQHGRFLPASGTAEQALSEALARFRADAGARPKAINLWDDPWLDLLLLPMRQQALSGPRTPVAIAYIHGDPEPQNHRIEQLKDLFGLTHREAGLALSMSRGRSISQAASDNNLTIQTARNYSKRIYSKTGARGHPDLVRIVLAGVIALA